MSGFYWSPVARNVFTAILRNEGALQRRIAPKYAEKFAVKELARYGFIRHDDHPTERDDKNRTIAAIYTTQSGRNEFEKIMQEAETTPSM